MHACGVCTFLNARVWKREKEGERNHIFGEITSRMWYWVHFTDGNRGILSALPRSGNEGQIVLVVWKWVRNNPSKVKKLVNRDYCVFMPLNKEKLPMTISIKLDFWTSSYTFFFYPPNRTIIWKKKKYSSWVLSKHSCRILPMHYKWSHALTSK